MSDRAAFGQDTTADEVLDGIDLTGKTALVTGGSSGLGAVTARALASKGARVIITARDMDKARKAVDEIKASTGSDVEIEELELGSFDRIRKFAERFLKKHDTLNILVNNAGVMACPQSTTQDGLELQFGSNHLGHFLMTVLIAPALIRGAPSRVVSLSSNGHRFSPVVFDDIQFERREYQKWAAYGQSKTANALFAVGLNMRLKDRGVEAFSVHPGAILTDLPRHLTDEDWQMFRDLQEAGTLHLKTVESGAATSVYAATAPELNGRGGAYLADCRINEIDEDPESQTGVCAYAIDPEAAERLWAISEEMIGLDQMHV